MLTHRQAKENCKYKGGHFKYSFAGDKTLIMCLPDGHFPLPLLPLIFCI